MDTIDKYFFIELVKSKVVGDAQAYLQYKTFANLDQLLAEIKRAFAPTENLPQIQADLARINQKRRESVSEYGLRCTKLLQKAIDLINENHEAAIIPGMVQGAISSAVKCFLIELSYEISVRMLGQHPNTLESSISAAIDIKRLVSQRKDTNRRDDSRSEPANQVICNPIEPKLGKRDDQPNFRSTIKCFQCGGIEHIS